MMRQIGNTRLAAPAAFLLVSFAAVAALVGLPGCTPWATYPPIEGAGGLNDPELHPIPDLMAESIWRLYIEDGRVGKIVFNLPPGTSVGTYEKVSTRLDGARPMTEPGEMAYHVVAVRVRTDEAEVDVLHVNADDVPELVTVSLRQNLINGIRVVGVRPWRFHVALPEPNFVPRTTADTRGAAVRAAPWDAPEDMSSGGAAPHDGTTDGGPSGSTDAPADPSGGDAGRSNTN